MGEDRKLRVQCHWPDLDHDVLAVSGVVQHTGQVVARRARKVMRKHDLNPTEFEVLMILRTESEGKPMTPSMLYDALVISSGGMTQVLRSLEEKGLVTRPEGAEDKRSRPVAITEAGVALGDVALRQVEAEERRAFAETGLTRKELDTLLSLLVRYDGML